MGGNQQLGELSQRQPEQSDNTNNLQQIYTEKLYAGKLGGDKSSMLTRIRSLASKKVPQLQEACKNALTSLRDWADDGPGWRKLLVGSVATTGFTLVGGLTTFFIVLAATAFNAILVAGLLTLGAIAGFLTIFLATVVAIAMVTVAVAAAVISWVTFCIICFILFTSGTLFCAWLIWKCVTWMASRAVSALNAAAVGSYGYKSQQMVRAGISDSLQGGEGSHLHSALDSDPVKDTLHSDAESQPKCSGASVSEAS